MIANLIEETKIKYHFSFIGEFTANLDNKTHQPRAAIFNLKTAALFCACGQKGGTSHDETEGENPRGFDRRRYGTF